jgi:hypothetical protein
LEVLTSLAIPAVLSTGTYVGMLSISQVTQPLKKRIAERKNGQKGLDNSGNIEGICIFQLP